MPLDIPKLEATGIYTRSPFFVSVNEVGQIEAKLNLWIVNGAVGTITAVTPTYTRSKKIASPTITEITFNLSNFINEFYDFGSYTPGYNVYGSTSPSNNYAIVRYQLSYRTAVAGTYKVVEDRMVRAYYGYGKFLEKFNPDLKQVHMTQGTYNYWNPLDTSVWPYPPFNTQPTNQRAGTIRIINFNQTQVKYTEIGTGAVTIQQLIYSNNVVEVFKVNGIYWQNGNVLEIQHLISNVWTTVATYTFLPVTECRFEPVIVDFVNKFGSFQRQLFYKASKESISASAKNYKLMPPNIDYKTNKPNNQTFNVNGNNAISINSGWVNDDFQNVLEELLMSETILINGVPALLTTKKIDYVKHINQKMINYKLEFEYAFDTIQNIL
jgi:hypothetical protein